MNVLKQNTIDFWYLLLIIVGYVFFCAFAIPLGIDEEINVFAYLYRLLVFFVSIFMIIKNFRTDLIKNYSILAFLAFWILYAIKIFYSAQNHFYEPQAIQWNELYARLLIIVIVPSLALLFIDYAKINFQKLTGYIFWSFFIMLFINLLYGIFNFDGNYRLKSVFNVYYISYGHYGTSLALISLFYILFIEKKPIYYIAFFLAILSIFITAARSPVLALSMVSLFLILLKRSWKYFIVYIILFICSIIGIYFYVKNGYDDFQLINRTYNWVFLGDNSLRTPLFEKSINLIKENIIWGNRVLYEDGMYPHNIFLELLMATGVLGFILYFLKFYPVVININLFLKSRYNIYFIVIFALFLQYFVLVNTSYYLVSVPEFLYLSAVIIGISLNYSYEKTKSNDGGRHPSRNY